MKITTWNVNSINVRIEQLIDFLENEKPTVIGLQELKCINEKFPLAQIETLDYHVVMNGQPTYNGVALLSNKPITDVVYRWKQL